MEITGFHHITAVASNAQRNIDFYTRVLGLKLVKATLDPNDSSSYLLYYGDVSGALISFVVWPHAEKGRLGSNIVASISLKVPQSSLGFWLDRFVQNRVEFQSPDTKFGSKYISFNDPDGLTLELVATQEQVVIEPSSDIPAESMVLGINNISVWLEETEDTEYVLGTILEAKVVGEDDNQKRFQLGEAFVDISRTSGFWDGKSGVGGVYHVGFAVEDEAVLDAVIAKLKDHGLELTAKVNMRYYTSVYFREANGIQFEISTKVPGFNIDEEKLGSELIIPDQFEGLKEKLLETLPPLKLPA